MISYLALRFFFGTLHKVEVDHLALATSEGGSPSRMTSLGAASRLGHTATFQGLGALAIPVGTWVVDETGLPVAQSRHASV